MSTGDIIVLLLFAVQGAALAAFLVNATITRRRYRRLRVRIQHLERVYEQIAPLTVAIAQLRAEMDAIMPMYLAMRQPSPRRSSTAHMRAVRQAMEEQGTQPNIVREPTQRIPFVTRPLSPDEQQ